MQKPVVSGDIFDHPLNGSQRPAKRSRRRADPILMADALRNAVALSEANTPMGKTPNPAITLELIPDHDTLCLGCLRLRGAYDTRPQGPGGRGQGVGYSQVPGT